MLTAGGVPAIGTPSAASAVSGGDDLTVFFEDLFDGSDLSSSKWNSSLATDGKRWCEPDLVWLDPAVEACDGVTDSSAHGSLSVGGGEASFASGDSRGFPYVWRGAPSRTSAFPASGDFVFEMRMRYDDVQGSGSGVRVGNWPDSSPEGSNSPRPGAIFNVWADTTGGQRFHLFDTQVAVGGVGSDHTYRLEYVDGEYSVFVDGTLEAGPTPSTQRPNVIWIGNPNFTSWAERDWSDFSIDFLRVEAERSDVGVPEPQTWGISAVDTKNPSGYQSDPVNTATGAFTTNVVDAAMAGIGVPFSFERHYTSADDTSGPLGSGWIHNLEAELLEKDGGVLVRAGNGQQTFFREESDGTFSPPPGGTSELLETADGYELRRRDQTVLRFDTAGQLTATEDRDGQGLSLAYAADGEIDEVVDAAGRIVDFTHDTNGLLTSLTLPDGRSVTFGYTDGMLTSVTDLRGGTTTYQYDSSGRLTTITDQNGNVVVATTYDSEGRVASQTDAGGDTGQFDYSVNADGTETTTYTDARGHVWEDVHAGHKLIQRRDPLGNTVVFDYDMDVNVVSMTDPRGNRTSLTYDARGNVLARTDPLGNLEEWTYNSAAQVLSYTDGRGHVTSYTYDASGNLTQVDAPEGATSTFTYTADGLLDTLTDPRGNTTDLGYDSAGNLVSVTDPVDDEATFSYDPVGRVVGAVDPRGNEAGATPSDFETTFGYDDSDNVTSVTDPLGHATTTTYDPVGNVDAVTDANGHVTDYGYDSENQLTTVEAPDGTTTTYTYDAVGNLTARTDANDNTETYGYDAADRLVSRTNAIGTWSYAYDANGNLESVAPPGGGSITTSYDVLDRPVLVDYSDDTPDVSFAYDANSNRTSMADGAGTVTYSYDALDRVTEIARGAQDATASAQTFAYGYDAASNIVSRTYPNGTEVTAGYDSANRLATLTEGANTSGFVYDAAGNLETTTLPNGTVESRSYDRAGRLVEVRSTTGSTVIARETLTLDAVGNPVTATDETGSTTSYLYDALDRLTKACFDATTCAGASDFVEYTYDPVGNRLSETRPSGTSSYSYNAADQLTSLTDPTGDTTTYEYDARGNQTRAGEATYSYDLANRMATATTPGDPVTTTRYTYDGDGVRLAADTEAAGVALSSSSFEWDRNNPLPVLAVERDELLGEDAAGTTQRTYTHTGVTPLSATTETTESYYHHDHLGSTRAVTDAGGDLDWTYDYEPYGAERTTTKHDDLAPDNRLRYTGQYQDPTLLYHLRARQYEPDTGRFTATDPVPAPLGTPHSNAYGYVNQRPTFGTDPSGLLCEICVGTGIGTHAKAGGGGVGGTTFGQIDNPLDPDYGGSRLTHASRWTSSPWRSSGPGVPTWCVFNIGSCLGGQAFERQMTRVEFWAGSFRLGDDIIQWQSIHVATRTQQGIGPCAFTVEGPTCATAPTIRFEPGPIRRTMVSYLATGRYPGCAVTPGCYLPAPR